MTKIKQEFILFRAHIRSHPNGRNSITVAAIFFGLLD